MVDEVEVGDKISFDEVGENVSLVIDVGDSSPVTEFGNEPLPKLLATFKLLTFKLLTFKLAIFE